LLPPAPEVIQQLRDISGTPEEQGMRFIRVLFPPIGSRATGSV